ncbi:hypothetical protein [Marinobacterium sp. BA1]|uniref:hypothetical protein n=1 Tax=Marinobacterium sp. BA1 TaxID=3138931 RepID=UPI0032E66AA7
MATNKSGKEIQDEYERLAREQLVLDSDWRLGTIATALPIGLEDKIEGLDSDNELCDSERWQELTAHSAPLAWLPKGVIQVTMVSGTGSEKQQKAGFILTENYDR